jgi:hypothetical protein
MSLKDAFAGIKEAQHSGTQAPKILGTKKVQEPPIALQGTAKSKHPEFEPVKIYVRSETRKRAWRKWEDAQGGDFSDLVQMLLEKYLGGT